MSKIILFLLGSKGYQVARAALIPDLTPQVDCIVIGEDPNIAEDCSGLIRDLCVERGVKFYFRKDFASAEADVSRYIALAAGWRWLIKENYGHLIVLHDSLLPKYRGFNPLVTALLNRDQYIGVTAILANKEFDRGDIITSRKCNVDYPIKISRAIEKISDLYFCVAQEIFNTLGQNAELRSTPQDDNHASYSVWRDQYDYRINWFEASGEVVHFINCVGPPYEGASSMLDGEIIRVLDAETFPDVEIANRSPGKVLFVDAGKPVVICGSGLLKINQAVSGSGADALPLKRFRVRLI